MKKFLRLFVVSLAFMVMCILPMACDNDKTPAQPETHTVTFVLNNGYDDVVIEVVDGKSIAETIEPFESRDAWGSVISGWYYDLDGDGIKDSEDPFYYNAYWDDEINETVIEWNQVFEAPVTKDIALIANWAWVK